MSKPRLIDANELYKLIEENSYMLVDAFNSKDKGMFLIGIKEAIDKTPTAYDIDKVVEQLEEASYCIDIPASANIHNPFEESVYRGIALDKAIEIVKGESNGQTD